MIRTFNQNGIRATIVASPQRHLVYSDFTKNMHMYMPPDDERTPEEAVSYSFLTFLESSEKSLSYNVSASIEGSSYLSLSYVPASDLESVLVNVENYIMGVISCIQSGELVESAMIEHAYML